MRYWTHLSHIYNNGIAKVDKSVPITFYPKWIGPQRAVRVIVFIRGIKTKLISSYKQFRQFRAEYIMNELISNYQWTICHLLTNSKYPST